MGRNVSVMDPPYNARGVGPRWDDTDAFRRALEDHEIVECPVPPVGYAIKWSGERGLGGLKICVPVPAGRRLTGAGARVLTLLPDPSRPEASVENSEPNTVSWFFVPEQADDVVIEGLDFVGEAPRVTPENHRLNLQPAVIEAAWGARAPRGLKIRDCAFRNQWGFVIHQRAGGSGYRIMHNAIRDCMNGININSDDAFYLDNDHERSEGFEVSGSRLQVLFNRFRDAYWCGIAYGGHTGPGIPENRSRDSQLIGNIIEGSYRHGINVTINTENTLVTECHIARTLGIGLFIGGNHDGTNQPRAVTLDNIRLVDCGGPDEANAVYLVDTLGAKLSRIEARYSEDPGYHQAFGLFVRGGRDIVVDDSNHFSGRHTDVYVVDGERITLPRLWRRPTRVTIERP